jgi:hypothetical protein
MKQLAVFLFGAFLLVTPNAVMSPRAEASALSNSQLTLSTSTKEVVKRYYRFDGPRCVLRRIYIPGRYVRRYDFPDRYVRRHDFSDRYVRRHDFSDRYVRRHDFSDRYVRRHYVPGYYVTQRVCR